MAHEHKHEIKVGDRINYVPHEVHKFDHVVRQGSVELPWVMGLKTVKNGKESIEELEGIRLTQVLESHKKGQIGKPNELVTIRPNITWDATVTAVHPGDKDSPDGYADLDVHTERGFTLHYTRIPIDHKACDHHGCHPKGEKTGMKSPDGSQVTDQASLAVVAALNEKVATLQSEKAELERMLSEATTHS